MVYFPLIFFSVWSSALERSFYSFHRFTTEIFNIVDIDLNMLVALC